SLHDALPIWTRDVTVNSQEIEPGLAGQFHVSPQLRWRCVSQRHTCRREVGAFDEHRFTVDGEHPILQHHLAEARSYRARIADDIVDRDLDFDVCQVLLAERPWPPQPRVVDVEVPVDLVEPTGQ